MPPLIKAYRIQEKVKGVGFEWKKKEDVWDKVIEELNELKYEVENGFEKDKMEDELGDLLFAITNYCPVYWSKTPKMHSREPIKNLFVDFNLSKLNRLKMVTKWEI